MSPAVFTLAVGDISGKGVPVRDTVAVPTHAQIRKIEMREWWLSWAAIAVTLVLTCGIASFAFSLLDIREGDFDTMVMRQAARGLVGLVLLFDVYIVYQQLQIHRMRQKLWQREELFRLISESAADMIAVVDISGKRIYNSPSYERVLGYTAEDLKQVSSREQIHPDDLQKVMEAAGEARKLGVGRRIEYRMRHKDGHWVLLESTASAVRNSKGDVDKLVIVNRDIGERRRLEEQFRQSQKMDAIGRLSGGVAHDFNNLLGVIIGYTEIVQESVPETSPLRASVDQILKAGKRAATLTRQLLAFSRQQVLEPKVLFLNAVVSDMEKMLNRLIGEDIELNTLLDPALGKVRADQGQLEQVIMNFTVNARDAMPEGGKLIIETRNMVMDDEFVRRYPYPVQPGPYVLLKVTDTGIGMDNATQQRVFEPFFTTKEKGKGTGLGLSTVYGVVKQSGGYIDIVSSPGEGTTFLIYLPRVHESIQMEKAPAGPSSSLRGSETILLVEDEENLRTLAHNILEHFGYTVYQASNGKEALEFSEKNDVTIHLLLTDIVMPGISGRVLAKQLLEQRPDMGIVYMSGYTGQTVGEQAVFEEGSHFIQKPFTRETLARKIRDALDAHSVSRVSQ